MSAIEKEKIFVELREYHTEAFPDAFSTPLMSELREEYSVVEDDTVSMLLNLVNGKVAFVDLSVGLEKFKEKVKVTKSTEKKEVADRNFFIAKIEHLEKILGIAKGATFHLKIPRNVKAAVAK